MALAERMMWNAQSWLSRRHFTSREDARKFGVPRGRASMISVKMPLWLRVVSVLGVTAACTAAGFYGYSWFNRPVTVTVAVGSVDGEAAKALSAIASQLALDRASVRLKVVDAGTAIEAGRQFAARKVDLAVVRGDVGDLADALAIAVVSHMTAIIIAPPGSSIDSIDKLKGQTVGVLGGEANSKVVDAVSNAYNLARSKVVFQNIALHDARQALQSRQISALLVVIPLTQQYLSLVKGLFAQDAKKAPVLIPIDLAGAIAENNRAYESFDVPKGTLRGSPPIPDDDLTTLRTSLYLVASKKLKDDVAANLAQAIMKVRSELQKENALLAQIAVPSTDPDAFIPVHPGAAAFYNGTQQSLIDEYSNYIYLGPMILGAVASVLAAAWKFLGIGQPEFREGPLDTLYGLGRRIRSATSEGALSAFEDQIDDILAAEGLKAAQGDAGAVDAATLNVIAHRLEAIVHERRVALLARSPNDPRNEPLLQ